MSRYIKVYELSEWEAEKYGKYLLECGTLTTGWDEIYFIVVQTQTDNDVDTLKGTADLWMKKSYLNDDEREKFIEERFNTVENAHFLV